MEKPAGVQEINGLFRDKAKGDLKGILDVSEEELVSMDFKDNSNSSIVDLLLTMVEGNLIKVISWYDYDNECGYGCRLAEMTGYISKNF